MKKTRQEKGITLIALIISIIILLILAAVTINAITGDGIIAKAQQAAEDYKTKADEESTTLENYLAKLEDADQSSGSESSGGSGSETGGGDSGGTGTIQIGVKYTANTELTDGSGDKFWVPSGYAVVLDENGKALVDKGIVITDAVDSNGNSTGNEWVWIPATVSEISEVVDGKNVGKLYNFTSTGATAMTYSTTSYHEVDVYSNSYTNVKADESFKEQLQSEFDSMLESVEEYGGYYIGRYETGGSTSSPVVKQGATVLKGEFYGSSSSLYTCAKNLAANTSVTTGMIWGCQWDNTLKWLVSSGNRTWNQLVDSKSWGNYASNLYDSETSEGMPDELGEVCSAGYSEKWKAGNIYDLAGNCNEWSMEIGQGDTDCYQFVWRGGDVNEWTSSDTAVAARNVYTGDGNVGFRATLTIDV